MVGPPPRSAAGVLAVMNNPRLRMLPTHIRNILYRLLLAYSSFMQDNGQMGQSS